MDEMPILNEEQMDQLLSLSEDELYMRLSAQFPLIVDGQVVYVAPAQAVMRGKEILKKYWNKLHQKICIEWRYCERRDQYIGESERTMLNIIMGLIAGSLGGGILAALIAAVLLNYGLDKFCGCGK